jgi:hypothetical protein
MSRLISDTSLYLLWKVIPKGVGIDRLKIVRSVAEKHDPAALHDFAEDVLTRRWRDDRERGILVELLRDLQLVPSRSIVERARSRLFLIQAVPPKHLN